MLTGDRHHGEELLQECLVKLYARWPQVARGGDPHAYLRRMPTNGNVSRWRRWRREWLVAEAPDRPDPRAALHEPDDALRRWAGDSSAGPPPVSELISRGVRRKRLRTLSGVGTGAVVVLAVGAVATGGLLPGPAGTRRRPRPRLRRRILAWSWPPMTSTVDTPARGDTPAYHRTITMTLSGYGVPVKVAKPW